MWVEAPVGSAAGWASPAELWVLATRFRAELKPGRNPKKLLRVYEGRGQHEQAGGKHQPTLGFHTSGSCFWVTLSFKPQFPSLDNGQMQPASHGRRKRSSFVSPRPFFTAPISHLGKLRLRGAVASRGPQSRKGAEVCFHLSSGQDGRVSTLTLRALPPHPENSQI